MNATKEAPIRTHYRTAGHVNITREVSRWERLLHDVRASESVTLRNGVDSLLGTLQDRAVDTNADPIKELGRVEKLAKGASAEIFAALYSGERKDLDAPAPDSEWITKIHEQLDALPQYQGLLENVKGDPDLSAVATAQLIEAVAPLLPAILGGDEPSNEPQSRREARRAARKAANEPSADQELRAILGEACNKASESAAAIRSGLGGLAPGLDETPPAHEQDSAARLRLAERLRDDEDLKRAMLLAGRLRRVSCSARKERDPNGCDELVGLTQGADLPRVLPTELALMRNPATRMLQLSKLAERKLQQYRLVGKTPQGRGPVVVLLDESGSMELNDRHVWSTAAALACLGHAARECRACTIIGFNGSVRSILRLDSEGVAWMHDRKDLATKAIVKGGCAELAMRVATSSPDGGTNFEAPVRCALDIEDGVTREKADLVLITDGQAKLPDQIIERLNESKKGGLRVFGLTVGGGSLGVAVNEICDHVAELDTHDTKEVASVLP